MIRFLLQSSIGLLLGLGVAATGAAAGSGADPWSFLEPAAIEHLALSGDGRQAAWVSPGADDSRVQLRVAGSDAIAIDGGTPQIIEGVGRVLSLRWLDARWLLQVEDLRGQPALWIGDAVGSRRLAVWPRVGRFDLMGPDRHGRVWVAHDRRSPHEPDFYRLDLASGEETLALRNPGRVFQWLIDREGSPRIARRWRPAGDGVHYEIQVLGPGHGYRTLIGHDLSAPGLSPLGLTPQGDALYLERSGPADQVELHRLDLTSGALGPALVDARAASVAGLRHDPLGGQLALVTLSGIRTEPVILDPDWRAAIDVLQRAFPEHRLDLVGRDAGGSQLWQVSAPASPGYLVWIDAERTLRRQSPLRSLEADALHAVRPFRFQARDGLSLDGYLTVPEGTGPWPTVLRVHGGPWARDDWRYDGEAQFLAELGYLVVQVNFRGSRGLGHARLMAGRGAWGRGMQDDLLDALEWTAGQGLSDPDRVCVMGASYGGYAALMGVIRDPGAFRCAVAHAPVTDLAAQIDDYRRDGNRRAWHEWRHMVGEPTTRGDQRLLSPIDVAETLRRPVLLSHGLADRDVDPEHSRRLVARAPGIRWLAFAGEGHTLLAGSSRRRYFQAVQAFFAEHLAPTAAKPAD